MPGTEMYWATFSFVCLELFFLFYLILYRIARPDDKAAVLNIILLFLLIIYNVTGGLLPDPKLPGSYFIQNSIAYATGFITPCYFPFYVYKGFDLKKMWFHAYRGIYFCLVFPCIAFVIVFAITGNLTDAKSILIVPTLYAIWVLYSLVKAIRYKYQEDLNSQQSRVEIVVLFLSLSPWVGLPIVAYYDFNQTAEVTITNTGFLMMMTLHLYRNVSRLKFEHKRLIESEEKLSNYEDRLKEEIEKYALEKDKMSSEERFSRNSTIYQLTKRETEIARLICTGLTNKAIGDTLFISERTVAKHVQSIFEKVQVSTRMELCQKLDVVAFIRIGDDGKNLKLRRNA
ncbi:MAG: LuxR C-terminal-related transcriptional regulator [Ferruginibacter sp.]